jgi:hypothetical protein
MSRMSLAKLRLLRLRERRSGREISRQEEARATGAQGSWAKAKREARFGRSFTLPELRPTCTENSQRQPVNLLYKLALIDCPGHYTSRGTAEHLENVARRCLRYIIFLTTERSLGSIAVNPRCHQATA